MSKRKPRPLARDSASLRDDRLFIVACDDTYAPQQYFAFFKIARIKVHVVPAEGGKSAARHVLDRLMGFEHEPDDELWMLLDTDHYTTGKHLHGFVPAITEARQKGVNVALSNRASRFGCFYIMCMKAASCPYPRPIKLNRRFGRSWEVTTRPT